MHIQILPGNLANMIAAGEVVQRPASVVKELMENAVDAGAGTITLAVQDAGRTLIQLIDDGCGMSPDDAMVCFERHATSKLSSRKTSATYSPTASGARRSLRLPPWPRSASAPAGKRTKPASK